MTNRYFVAPLIETDTVTLVGPEAHHMIHVMRASPGAEAMLFDGSGAEFLARVSRIDRTRVELDVLARIETDRELSIEVTLAVTLPKGDRQKWLVEKAVELGVRRIVPLRTARSVAKPGEKALERLRRTIIEASKQCGRNILLEIGKPVSWADFVESETDVPCRLLAHPRSAASDDQPGSPAGRFLPQDLPGKVVLAVGPEGGFTRDEVSLATSAGWCTIDLGSRILRIETAAILLTAMVSQLTTNN
jgi:16S rRNA (uracil1498-N3)-methyltransferase